MLRHRQLVDLSAAVSPEDWEPEPVKRRVIDHRAGADMLGQSYLYFHAGNLWQRLWAIVGQALGDADADTARCASNKSLQGHGLRAVI